MPGSDNQTLLERQSLYSNSCLDSDIESNSLEYGSISRHRCISEVTSPIGISWHNLTIVHKKTNKKILDNVSGFAQPGQLIALMGSSGAGKTTLLNTLTARNMKDLHITGQVLVGGNELGSRIKYISGICHQDELFVSTLTVKEWLAIQARLRMASCSKEMIRKRVFEIIIELGLYACKDTKIGQTGIKKGISGGEARRLSLASELLENPSLLFADEPTSGLDSTMAESVISLMSKLVSAGRTIICTIHQPSSTVFRKFDRVIFLSKGKLAYFGEPAKAVEFMEAQGYPCPMNYNPADAMIDALSIQMHKEAECIQRIKTISEGFQDSKQGREFARALAIYKTQRSELPSVRKNANYCTQTMLLLERSIIDCWRNPGLTRTKVFQKVVMGLFIGLLYWQTPLTKMGISNLNGAMFYMVAELSYSTLFGVLNFLPSEFPLLVREYHDGLYSLFPYYVAKFASYMPLFALDGLIMVGICYWMAGLVQTLPRFAMALVISILIEQCAVAFGVMVSSVCPSYPVAITLSGPVVTALALTGGFFANVGELPAYISWAQYISWFRYGFEAFSINQWEGALCDNSPAKNSTNACSTMDSILLNFSFNRDNMMFDLFALVMITLCSYSIGFLGLLFRVRRAR